MSDSRRRYDGVSQRLRQILPEQWVQHYSQMVNLSLLVSAIPGAKDLTQHALAAEMPVKAQNTSLAQRQRRWAKDEQVQERGKTWTLPHPPKCGSFLIINISAKQCPRF